MAKLKRVNKKVLFLLLLAGLMGLAMLVKRGAESKTQVTVFKVLRGGLTIAVTSGGSIQSRDKAVINSELEGNNTVVWVIPEGTNVQNGRF